MKNTGASLQAILRLYPVSRLRADAAQLYPLMDAASQVTKNPHELNPVKRRISEAFHQERRAAKTSRHPAPHLQKAGLLHTAWYEMFQTDLFTETELLALAPSPDLNSLVIGEQSNKPALLPVFSAAQLQLNPPMAYELLDHVRSANVGDFNIFDIYDRIQQAIKLVKLAFPNGADTSSHQKNLEILEGARRLIYAGTLPLQLGEMHLSNWDKVSIKILGQNDLPRLVPFLRRLQTEDYAAMVQFDMHGPGGEPMDPAVWHHQKTEKFPLFSAGAGNHTDILATISPDAGSAAGWSAIATHPAYPHPGVVMEVIKFMLRFAESHYGTIKASVHESRVAVLAAYHEVTYRSLRFRHTRTIAGQAEFVLHF